MEYFREAEELDTVLKEIQREYTDHVYHLEHLHAKFLTFYRDGIQVEERLDLLKKAAVELTTQEAPLWEFAAGRILHLQFTRRLEQELKNSRYTIFMKRSIALQRWGFTAAIFWKIIQRRRSSGTRPICRRTEIICSITLDWNFF